MRSPKCIATLLPLSTFATPDTRFDQVHIDLVGPLPPSSGSVYLLTCVDRFTHWPEAVPIPDSTEETVARAFIQTWIAHFGTPSAVTTDRGRQFESHLWCEFSNLLGTKHLRTTAYHPIVRFHCQLKASLKAYPHPERLAEALPLVLLGIWTSLKEDIACTSAELEYGTTLRLPGEFLTPSCSDCSDPSSNVTHLKSVMYTLQATLPRHPPSQNTAHATSALEEAFHVFVRHNAVKKPLQQPYDGPFRVLKRSAKLYTLDLNGRRLKPAHLDLHTPSLTPLFQHALNLLPNPLLQPLV